jgi:hemolysin activation/secretion protein
MGVEIAAPILRPRLAMLLGLAMLAAPAAAQRPPSLPGAIERVAPPATPELGPPLLPPEPARATGPGETRQVPIAAVQLSGNLALDEAALRPAIAGLAGRAVRLAEIETARLALLGAYRAAGFPYVAVTARLAQAEGGGLALRFAVTEGFIAAISLEGAEIGPAAALVTRMLAPLIDQRPLAQAALERALLLAGDIPGMDARGLLRPSTREPGAMDLVVQLSRRPVTGYATLDNRGYPLTGAWQGLLVGQLNAFTARGERTELALLQSEGNGQSFIQVAEEIFIGSSGLRLRAYAGAGRAAPGSALAAIGYAGDTRVAGAALIYPLLRSRPMNVTLTGQFDAFDSQVQIRPGPGEPRERLSRDAVRALRLGVDGAAQDGWLGFAPAAATSTALLRLHRGLESLGATSGDAAPTSRFGSDFGFTRVVAEASRLQPLWSPAEGWLLSAYGLAAAQWSDDVLPPAEKFYLGGNRLGRGFYAGQVTGDRAYGYSAELQLAVPALVVLPFVQPVQLGAQAYLFRDFGRAFQNAVAEPDRHLSSWGGGLRLQFDERVQLDLEAVRRITRTPDGPTTAPLSENAVFARLLLRY